MPDSLPTFDLSGSRTVYDYLMSDAFVSGITGPVGSGKSVGSCLKILRHASSYPIDRNGFRRSRCAVIRNTYPELKTTTVKTWMDTFIGQQVPHIVYSSPIRHHLVHPPVQFEWVDFAKGEYRGHPGLDLEVLFMAMDTPKDVAHLKSLDLSFAWINEGSEVVPAVIDMLTARVGRYPKPSDMSGEPWVGIFYDTNASDETVWTEETEANGAPEVIVTLPDGSEFTAAWAFFRQEGAVLEVAGDRIAEPGHSRQGETIDPNQVMFAAGRGWVVNPLAENIGNLRRGYYNQQITNKSLDWIQRFLQAKRVYIADGKPWVPEFSQMTMVRSLRVDPQLPLLVGMDAGGGTLNPSAVWGQIGTFGDWRMLSELVIEDIGIDRFVDAMIRHHQQKFRGIPMEAVFADPAANKRDEVYETKVEDFLRSKGLPVQLAPSNDINVRRQALARPMGRGMTLPGTGEFIPGFLVDPSCKTLIAALSGKWYRAFLNRGGGQQVKDKPEKNHPYSDVGDACSYLCLGGGEDMSREALKPMGGQLAKRAAQFGGHIPIKIEFPDL